MQTEVRNHLADESTPLAPSGHSTPGAGIEISLVELFIIFARRKKFILTWALGLAILAGIVAFILPVSYTASTAILPPQQNSSSSSALLSQLGGAASLASMGSGLSLKNPVDLYVALMKTEAVENAFIKRYRFMEEYHSKDLWGARKTLEDQVSIDGGVKDGIIRVSVTDHSAARAAELANGYVAEYRRYSATLATTEAAQRRLFFEQQLVQAKNNLADSEESLMQTEQTTGVIQMDSQARALIESAGSLRAEIAAKEVQIQSMGTYAAEGNVDLVQARQELAGLQAQLAKLAGAGDPTNVGLMVSKGQLPKAGLEYVRKLRDVKYNETIFGILARQYEMAKLDEAKEGSLIQVVDAATVPEHKSKPRRSYYIVGGFVAGFILSMLIVFAQAVIALAEANPEHRHRLGDLRKALSVI
jgi:tyrosine-protein kinase Etk/Wzc